MHSFFCTVKFPKFCSKMRTILLLICSSIFFGAGRSNLEANIEYFVMTEAHIPEYRTNEDANSRYIPFYIECRIPTNKYNCQPVIPKLNEKEGYVIIEVSDSRNNILYYGCPQKINLEKVLNPGNHFQNALIMYPAKSPFSLELYKHTCEIEVSPALWRIGPIQGVKVLYGIGFIIPGLKKMPIAKVYYNQHKKIPIWTKHTLHGASLATPIAAFRSYEEIVYQEDSEIYTEFYLEAVLEYYFRFNEEGSAVRRHLNAILALRGLEQIPDSSKIVMGHLIPEYDMITSWQKVSRFAQTIVPTWEELYLNEWIDVEEMIREESFMKEKELTVFSGTHGQLTFNIPGEEYEQKPKFYLGKKKIFVPEMIWKLVIDETSYPKKATVIIFCNLTEQLERLKIFADFTPPCSSKCSRLRQKKTDEPSNLIYCCAVNEVKNKIEELPIDAIKEDFDALIK